MDWGCARGWVEEERAVMDVRQSEYLVEMPERAKKKNKKPPDVAEIHSLSLTNTITRESHEKCKGTASFSYLILLGLLGYVSFPLSC